MRNIEYYRGLVAKVRGGQTAMGDIDPHQVTSFQGRNGPLSYKLKLIAKKSISYRSQFDSRGSSTPLGRWPGEYIHICTSMHALIACLSMLLYDGNMTMPTSHGQHKIAGMNRPLDLHLRRGSVGEHPERYDKVQHGHHNQRRQWLAIPPD